MKRKQNQALTAAMVASVVLFVGTLIGGGAWVASAPSRERAVVQKNIAALDREYADSYMYGTTNTFTKLPPFYRKQTYVQVRFKLEQKLQSLGGTPPPRPRLDED
jgi:hypothetical protein